MIRNTLLLLLASLTLTVGAAPAAKAKPGRGEAINLLGQGQALERQKDYDGAMAAYTQSVQAAPSAAAYYQLGRLCSQRGDSKSARTYLTQALELNPEYELAKIELAKVDKGAGSADDSMNVDQIQREYETLSSMRAPTTVEVPVPGSYPTGQSNTGKEQSFVPRAPQNPGSGDNPGVPVARANPTPAGTAKQNLTPPDTVVMENDSNPRVMVARSGKPTRPEDERNVAQGIALSPAQAAEAAEKVSESRVAPQYAESEQVQPMGRIARDGGAAGAQAEGGMPSVEEINKAAFSEKAASKPSSIGYGNQDKVALNTFAFHRDRGDSYRAAGRFRDAATEYEIALKLNPTDTETRTLLGEMFSRSGDDTAAQAQFSKAEAEAPNDPRAQYKKGNVYRDQGKLDLAIGAYRKALRIDDDYMFAHNNLGVVYMQKGDYSEAVKQFKRVLEIDPNYDKAMLNLGIIYDDHLANKPEALKYYEMYVERKGERAAEVRRWIEAIRERM